MDENGSLRPRTQTKKQTAPGGDPTSFQILQERETELRAGAETALKPMAEPVYPDE
jgi:hypothetical protein